MKRIGAHVSIAGGVRHAPGNARAIGARAFALFTRNQRQWRALPLAPEEAAAFRHNLAEAGFRPGDVLPHDSYLINLGNPDSEAREKSLVAFIEEMGRCHALGLTMLNFHPGSHLSRMDPETCLIQIAQGINQAMAAVPEVVAVIENTAGQGSNLGWNFEQIAAIIDGIEDKTRVGVCLDTCHAFAAGYDLSHPAGYQEMMANFDRIIGLDRLRGMHLNDAKAGLGSRLDRHASLGKGTLGWEPFRWIVNDPRLDEIPLILETVAESLWPLEIHQLYAMIEP